MNAHIVIPARLGSSRLPGKVLADLQGQPVLAHVIAAAKASEVGEVWVASDADEVLDIAAALGVNAARTRSDHESGSDRIAEVARQEKWADDEMIVNLQGDEPFMPAALLRAVAELLAASANADWATVAAPLTDPELWSDPSCVKVVCADDGAALYFSRASIPHERDSADTTAVPPGALRHIGLYAYRVGALLRYCRLQQSRLERLERLEQLRALEAGMRIMVHQSDQAPPLGIDTPEDLALARQRLASREI